jgi:4-hydroxybenzoate polyprenyltransferase
MQYSALLPTIFTIFLAGTCMVQNDWRDRKQDTLKGKCFASRNELPFLFFLLILWSATIALAVMLRQEQTEFGWLAVAGVSSGLIYSETRKIPMIPALLVALTSASPTLFPVVISYSPVVLLLFLSTALLIFGREILKDLDDMNCDKGYKWTLPVSIGSKQAKVIAGVFILTASVASLALSLKTFLGVTLLITSAICLMTDKSHKTAKKLIDISVLLTLASLLVFGT